MIESAENAQAGYTEEKDSNIEIDSGGVKQQPSAIVFKAGQSKRIWNELYKVSVIIIIIHELQLCTLTANSFYDILLTISVFISCSKAMIK